MISFRKVLLSDKAAIDNLLKDNTTPVCDYCFANIYAWQPAYDTEWAEVCGMLVVRFRLPDGDWAYMPVGGGDIGPVLGELHRVAAADDSRLRLVSLDGRFANVFGEEYAICDNPDYRDYIYLVEDMCELRGRKYQPKRNHINRFESSYNYTFEVLRPTDFEECLALTCLWHSRKCSVVSEACCEQSDEHCAIKRVFEAYDQLDMLGGVLRVDGRVVAFAMGSPLSRDTFCVHFEKADADYQGVFPMINRLFAKELAQRGYIYVNREEDMGLEGLRRAKQSFYPVRFEPKLGVAAITKAERECIELWHEVFGDEKELINHFFVEYFEPRNLLFTECDGRVVAMLYIVEINTDFGSTAYLYAIATHPAWRGQGIASELIAKALEHARERGCRAAMLIPGEESLKSFYAKFGFEDVAYKLDFADGFDYGTGDSERDLAMVKHL